MNVQSATLVPAGFNPGRMSRRDLGLDVAPSPARTGLEAVLTLLFGEVLDIGDVGADDNFFALGGDSIMAAKLFVGIERELGCVLPASTLISHSTPRRLAELIALDGRSMAVPAMTCLVPVRRDGKGPPVICVHGMRGDAFSARGLSMALNAERPVYALRAGGLLEGERPDWSVRAMARRYVRDVLREIPAGPYLLIGYCGGAVIAYEMVRQLGKAGCRVPALIMIDPDVRAQHLPWMFEGGLRLLLRRLASIAHVLRVQWSARRRGGATSEGRRTLVAWSLAATLRGYLPRPGAVEVFLIYAADHRARLMDPQWGLPRFVGRIVEAAEGGPDHDSLFTSHFAQVGRLVSSFLDRKAPV
jgi:acyl carrier protein